MLSVRFRKIWTVWNPVDYAWNPSSSNHLKDIVAIGRPCKTSVLKPLVWLWTALGSTTGRGNPEPTAILENLSQNITTTCFWAFKIKMQTLTVCSGPHNWFLKAYWLIVCRHDFFSQTNTACWPQKPRRQAVRTTVVTVPALGSKTPPGVVLGTRNCPWFSTENVLSKPFIKKLTCTNIFPSLRRRSESPIGVAPTWVPPNPPAACSGTHKGVHQTVTGFGGTQEPVKVNRNEIYDWFRKIDIIVSNPKFLLWVCVQKPITVWDSKFLLWVVFRDPKGPITRLWNRGGGLASDGHRMDTR